MANNPSRSASDIITELDIALRNEQHTRYAMLKFKPVSADQVAAAEARLGVKLPQSYVELVTRVGAFEIVNGKTGQDARSWYPLLSPDEIVQHTPSQRPDGEMGVHSFYHDDTNEWGDEFLSFEEHIDDWAGQVLAEVDEET